MTHEELEKEVAFLKTRIEMLELLAKSREAQVVPMPYPVYPAQTMPAPSYPILPWTYPTVVCKTGGKS